MANIKSAKKRILTIEKKTQINKAQRTKMKTSIKNFYIAEEEGNKENAELSFQYAQKVIRKTASKGIIHKNTASRKISRLRKRLNQMAQ